jgi:hypothetical protein
MLNKLTQIRNFIENNKSFVIEGVSATDDNVNFIENNLCIKIPNQYLLFLKEWGTLLIQGCFYGYYGIFCFEGRLIFDVVNFTLDCRRNGLPNTFLAFSSDEGDEYLCMDTEPDNPEILVFDFFKGNFRKVLAHSFFDAICNDINDHAIPFIQNQYTE